MGASFPGYCQTIEQALRYIGPIVAWFKVEHMHFTLDDLTPQQIDLGQGLEIQKCRNEVIQRASIERASRFGTKMLVHRVPAAFRLTFHETVTYTRSNRRYLA